MFATDPTYRAGGSAPCDHLPHLTCGGTEVAIYPSAMPDSRTIAARSRPWLAALALYAVAAVVGTWPLALRISTHLPLGSLHNATVPFFNLWTLEHNVRSLARGYAGYWDAPIFYPTPGAFALSEAQALT